ncbi:mannitol dehydrogenase family protein [Microlunatus aurantiacus]|uniref:Mannitol-1-phosphate 5-dehydrogenase n=1 Tax=Microlunatus aurantiacus TaxID=446786 RepID=A0ABP7DF67_9ACTN
MSTSPERTTDSPPRLSRALPGTPPAAPVRIVHLGLGNFHRAHQAWYTAHAGDAADWGIAAFTGRRPDAADALAPQDGLSTLITRASDGDAFELVGSLTAVHAAADHQALLDYLRRPEVAVVTITVTEQGYLADAARQLRRTEAVVADIAALQGDPAAPVTTLPARLVGGLAARRAAGAGAITILSCDNLPENGEVAASVVTQLAQAVDPALAEWIAEHVDFASSMVDRITPTTTDADRALVTAELGYVDASPVATEPFHEWVMSGRFPAGRPRWEDAGARVVDDVTPFEQRKLWLLNGSHSLLAYAGSIRGHASIDEAIADPACREWVEALWDEAAPHLPLPAEDVAAYRSALLQRYANSRIRHQLAQIVADGSTKVVVRTVPVIRAERAAGRVPLGCATVVAAWIRHLRGAGAPLNDGGAEPYLAVVGDDDETAVRAVLALLGPADEVAADLQSDDDLVAAVIIQLSAIG